MTSISRLCIAIAAAIISHVSLAQEGIDIVAEDIMSRAAEAQSKAVFVEYDVKRIVGRNKELPDMVINGHVLQASTEHEVGISKGLFLATGTIQLGMDIVKEFGYGYDGNKFWILQHNENEVLVLDNPTVEAVAAYLGFDLGLIPTPFFTNPSTVKPGDDELYYLQPWSPRGDLVGFRMKWERDTELGPLQFDTRMAFRKDNLLLQHYETNYETKIFTNVVNHDSFDRVRFDPIVPDGYTIRRAQKDDRPAMKSLVKAHSVAPDFELNGSDSKKYRLSEAKGKVIVLDFSASWCAPCKRSMPTLSTIATKFKDSGVEVWCIDASGDGYPSLTQHVTDNSYRFTLLLDGDDILELYGVRALPTVCVISKDGLVHSTHYGYSDKLDSILEHAIRECQ